MIVATIRALKMHGGVLKTNLKTENVEALKKGFTNLQKHIENIHRYGLPVVVAINEFSEDTAKEEACLIDLLKALAIPVAITSVWENGPTGGVELAEAVMKVIENQKPEFVPLYEAATTTVREKVEEIAKTIYGGSEVQFSKTALKQMQLFSENGWEHLPVCMAKTQYSLSDDPLKLGRPTNFDITIREFVPKLGAGFIVALTGEVMTMPGLPKKPAALKMDITEDGKITGLF